MNIRTFLLPVFVILMIYILAVYYYKAYMLAYKLSHPNRIVRCISADSQYDLYYFSFKSKAGKKFAAVEVRPKKYILGTILICHNLGGSKEGIVEMLLPLAKEGYQLVAYDYVNHGKSYDSKGIKFSLREDFDLFFNAVRSRGIGESYIIMGYSMGATNVIYSLVKYDDIKIGIIDSGPLLDVKSYFTYVLNDRQIKNIVVRKFFVFLFLYIVKFQKMKNDTLKDLERISDKRLLFIHGNRDNIININNAYKAIEHLKYGYSRLVEVPNSRHLTNCFILKEKYYQLIKDFINYKQGDQQKC